MTRLSSLPGKYFVLPVVFLSCCWNVPRFFELYTCTRRANVTLVPNTTAALATLTDLTAVINITDICPTDMRRSYHYSRYRVYHVVVDQIFGFLIKSNIVGVNLTNSKMAAVTI